MLCEANAHIRSSRLEPLDEENHQLQSFPSVGTMRFLTTDEAGKMSISTPGSHRHVIRPNCYTRTCLQRAFVGLVASSKRKKKRQFPLRVLTKRGRRAFGGRVEKKPVNSFSPFHISAHSWSCSAGGEWKVTKKSAQKPVANFPDAILK